MLKYASHFKGFLLVNKGQIAHSVSREPVWFGRDHDILKGEMNEMFFVELNPFLYLFVCCCFFVFQIGSLDY